MPPRLVDVPISVIIRHRPDEPARGNPIEAKALASLRPWLKPSDQADDLHSFITLAVQRALPRLPKFKSFDLNLTYGYEAGALEEYMDPGDSYSAREEGPHKFKSPLVILCTSAHRFTALGEVLEHLHQRDADVAQWLVALLNALPFSESKPMWWRGVIGNAFWMGEEDEETVKAEYASEQDGYQGPTLADYFALVPEWVRTASPELIKDWVINLRLCARAQRLGLDVGGFFDLSGELLAPDGMRPLWIHHPTTPMYYTWKKRDIIEQAIDEDKECQMQSGFGTDAFGGINAADITQASAVLVSTYKHLSALDAFIQSFAAYGRQHKLVT